MISILPLLIISSVEFFNNQPIYEDPIAAPRTANSYVSVKTSTYLGTRLYYLEAAIGKNMPIATLKLGDKEFQLGVDAATWVDLGYNDGAFPLLLQDFLFSFPLSFRYGNFSAAFKFNHISAHLGDGMDVLLEKTLSDEERAKYEQAERIGANNGLDVSLATPFGYSRDFESLNVAYKTRVKALDVKVYAHAGYAHKIHPDYLGRWFGGNGIELQYTTNTLTPYYAQDITWNQDMDSLDYSAQTGMILGHTDGDLLRVRLATTMYAGSDRRGQLMGRKLRQLGFGVFID